MFLQDSDINSEVAKPPGPRTSSTSNINNNNRNYNPRTYTALDDADRYDRSSHDQSYDRSRDHHHHLKPTNQRPGTLTANRSAGASVSLPAYEYKTQNFRNSNISGAKMTQASRANQTSSYRNTGSQYASMKRRKNQTASRDNSRNRKQQQEER